MVGACGHAVAGIPSLSEAGRQNGGGGAPPQCLKMLSAAIFSKLATAGIGAVSALRLAPWILEAEAAQASAVDAIRNDLADAALAAARRLGASYADVRVNRLRSEAVSTREQQVQNVSRNQSAGFGLRVLVNGAWGFAASPQLTVEEARRVAEAAVAIAKANARFQRKRIALAPADPVTTSWRSTFKRDPFEVPLDDEDAVPDEAQPSGAGRQGVSFVNSQMRWIGEQKFFATSRRIADRPAAGPQLTRVHRHGRRPRQRRLPDARVLDGPQGMGYEYVETYPWDADARQAGHEVVRS